MYVLPIELRIDRAQRLLRMIEDDAPLLAARVAPLSAEQQKSAKSYAQRLAERTRGDQRVAGRKKPAGHCRADSGRRRLTPTAAD